MQINWSPHDGNIYISNNLSIFKYDPVRKEGEIVEIPGMYFSDDGKYSLKVGMSGTTVYLTSDGEPVAYLNDSLASLGKVALYRSWASDGQAILITTGNGQYYVVSLSDGRVIKEFKGQLLGKNHEGTKFIIHPMKADEKGRMKYNKEAFEMIVLP